MLEVIGVLLFLWLMGKVSGLLFRLAWEVVKVVAILLLAAALPILAAGLLCAGGMMLLVPSGLLLLILALLKGDVWAAGIHATAHNG